MYENYIKFGMENNCARFLTQILVFFFEKKLIAF